jgi:hypothetical protein
LFGVADAQHGGSDPGGIGWVMIIENGILQTVVPEVAKRLRPVPASRSPASAARATLCTPPGLGAVVLVG